MAKWMARFERTVALEKKLAENNASVGEPKFSLPNSVEFYSFKAPTHTAATEMAMTEFRKFCLLFSPQYLDTIREGYVLAEVEVVL